uniref:Non-specific lipid-transfer protein n=1 Tax=Kalanchoe fedtschenkoi TaxID=63787 RepID=A0A7N0ZQW0_KALFE
MAAYNKILATAAAVVLLALMVASAGTTTEAAVTCGTVASSINPCLDYLKGSVAAVPGACCSGIKSLNAAASTTPDRQTACECLKSAASSISGINYGLAAGLPGKCGVSIPYKISPSTDCNQVK